MRRLSRQSGEAEWFAAGQADRVAGNIIPAVTPEDFYRDVADPNVARKLWEAYRAGFEGREAA